MNHVFEGVRGLSGVRALLAIHNWIMEKSFERKQAADRCTTLLTPRVTKELEENIRHARYCQVQRSSNMQGLVTGTTGTQYAVDIDQKTCECTSVILRIEHLFDLIIDSSLAVTSSALGFPAFMPVLWHSVLQLNRQPSLRTSTRQRLGAPSTKMRSLPSATTPWRLISRFALPRLERRRDGRRRSGFRVGARARFAPFGVPGVPKWVIRGGRVGMLLSMYK